LIPLLAQASTVDLVKLIPDGTNLVAIVVVIVLFLKQQDKFNSILNTITAEFSKENRASQEAFQEQIGSLAKQYFENQNLYQQQIQKLMDAHIQVTKEVIAALQELKQVVTGINQRLDYYDKQLEAPKNQPRRPS
jgi:hypothetical protein